MTLEDLVEAHLEGKEVDVPEELRADFGRAVAGYDALQYALGETIAVAEAGPSDRSAAAAPAAACVPRNDRRDRGCDCR